MRCSVQFTSSITLTNSWSYLSSLTAKSSIFAQNESNGDDDDQESREMRSTFVSRSLHQLSDDPAVSVMTKGFLFKKISFDLDLIKINLNSLPSCLRQMTWRKISVSCLTWRQGCSVNILFSLRLRLTDSRGNQVKFCEWRDNLQSCRVFKKHFSWRDLHDITATEGCHGNQIFAKNFDTSKLLIEVCVWINMYLKNATHCQRRSESECIQVFAQEKRWKSGSVSSHSWRWRLRGHDSWNSYGFLFCMNLSWLFHLMMVLRSFLLSLLIIIFVQRMSAKKAITYNYMERAASSSSWSSNFMTGSQESSTSQHHQSPSWRSWTDRQKLNNMLMTWVITEGNSKLTKKWTQHKQNDQSSG